MKGSIQLRAPVPVVSVAGTLLESVPRRHVPTIRRMIRETVKRFEKSKRRGAADIRSVHVRLFLNRHRRIHIVLFGYLCADALIERMYVLVRQPKLRLARTRKSLDELCRY